MGRYISCGVVTKIEIIEKNNENYKILENKHDVTEQLNKYINVSDYDIIEYDNALGFELKIDIFNQNINSLFDELDTIIDCKKRWLYDHREETITLELDQYNDDYPYKSDLEKERYYGNYYVKTKNDEYGDEETYPPSNCWILHNNFTMLNNLKVYIHVIPLWFDLNKISIESEYHLLHIINTLKTGFFKTPLSKNLIIYISG